MDDLLREFLTETAEHLDTVDVELVRFEQSPSDQAILNNIFRLVHTIKGTCGFLGLPRLEALAHAAENLMDRLRGGAPVTSEAVTLILSTVDRIKLILSELDRISAEPAGSDCDIIDRLERAAAGPAGRFRPAAAAGPADRPPPPARPGEVSPEELERAFRAAPGPGNEGQPAEEPGPGPARPAPAAAAAAAEAESRTQMIRVGVETLEHLMTMVSELVLTRNQLLELSRRSDADESFKAPLQRLSHVTAELQEGIMKTRMQPIGSAWAKLPRLVRDLAPELGKTIELSLSGSETELDRQLLEVIRGPLIHMVRNSADHGLEKPADRVAAGKPSHGTIRLSAFQEGGTITIEVADDGRGLDFAAIRRRAVETGIVKEAEASRLTDDQVSHFIFHPGFSTAATVSAISGRGVGMDVVKSNLALVGGTVDISSEPGRGTVFTIKVPLTLAIAAALIVGVGDQRFAVPQMAVLELVRVRPGGEHALERISGTPVLRLRDELLPIVEVAGLMELPSSGGEAGFVVVAQVGRQRFGMMVDAVLETEEIVVKPLSARLRGVDLFSGNTVLGDGAVVLILDPNGVARRMGAELVRGLLDPGMAVEKAAAESDRTTLLVFRAGDGAPKAVPLSLVMRLEEFDAADVEWIGGRPALQYRGRLMPLVPVDEAMGVRREGSQPVIVFAEGERLVGLAVSEILDVVDASLSVEPIPGRPDLVGSAIVRDRATEIVDVAAFLPWSGPAERGRPGSAAERATILLVDDNPFFRDMLVPVLKAAGYRVKTAARASEALQLVAAEPVGVLVADLDLGDASGLDLIAAARAGSSATPFAAILLSSGASGGDLRRARELGVFDVVSKFDRRGLMAALAEIGQDRRDAA